MRFGSLLASLRERFRRPRRSAERPNDRGASSSELAQRRDQLAGAYTAAQWDLGGLVYEMARRDYFRMDLVVRQAARLQDVDAELGEVERLLRLEEAAAAGTCTSCGALHAPGAAFCWKCGESLTAPAPVEGRIVGTTVANDASSPARGQ